MNFDGAMTPQRLDLCHVVRHLPDPAGHALLFCTIMNDTKIKKMDLLDVEDEESRQDRLREFFWTFTRWEDHLLAAQRLH